MSLLQVLLVAGVVWVAAILVVCAWFMARDAMAQEDAWFADEEEWGLPHRIDQRRD